MIRFKPMKIVGGFEVKPADPYGGKAGRGKNVTSTVQVWRHGMFLKHFVYQDSAESLIATIKKAQAYIETDPRPLTRATMLMPELYRATLYSPGKPKRVLHKHQVEELGLQTDLSFGMRHLKADAERVGSLLGVPTGSLTPTGDTSSKALFSVYYIERDLHPDRDSVAQNLGARGHLRRLGLREMAGQKTPWGELLIIERIIPKQRYAE